MLVTKKPSAAVVLPAKVPYLIVRRGKYRYQRPGQKGFNLSEAGRELRADIADDYFVAARLVLKLNADHTKGLKPLPKPVPGDHTMEELVERYKASVYFLKTRDGRPRPEKTQISYSDFCKVLLNEDNFRGARLSEIEAMDQLELADHFATIQEDSVSLGFHLHAMFRLLLNVAIKLKWIRYNPASKLHGITNPAGRKTTWSDDEIATYIDACKFVGRECQIDALVFALVTGQGVSDIVNFPMFEIAAGYIQLPPRRKTGNVPFAPLAPLLTDRLELIAARREALRRNLPWANAQLISTSTNDPYPQKAFMATARAIRYLAAGDLERYATRADWRSQTLPDVRSLKELPFKTMPSLAGKHFHDLRATAVTRYLMSVGTEVQAIITAHALQNVSRAVDLNYFHRQGKLVAESKAHAAWDELYARLKPHLNPRHLRRVA